MKRLEKEFGIVQQQMKEQYFMVYLEELFPA
jgi:hypothetical protein